MNKVIAFIHKTYRIFLVFAVLLCIAAAFIVPTNVYVRSSAPQGGLEITPTECVRTSPLTREFHFNHISWDSASGSCLLIPTTHEEVSVSADGVLLYERLISDSLFGHTPGCAYEFVEIPEDTAEVVVTMTACYANVADLDHTFYQGSGAAMLHYRLIKSFPSTLISMMIVILGCTMIVYWVFLRIRANAGKDILYLGTLAVLIGCYSTIETDFAQILFSNRAACSFITFIILMMLCIPFMLFFHDYLHDDIPWLCPVLCCVSLIQILVSVALQLSKIADLRDVLFTTHMVMVLAAMYFLIVFVRALRARKFLKQIRVSIIGMTILIVSFFADLFFYYTHVRDANSFGRLGFFIFILALGIDTSATSLHLLEEGRKAIIYKELAEKDLLTSCFNRNAYHNDTLPEKLKDGLLLVTFDLNNLKYYNDTFGHACGDQYLIDSVTIMQKVFEPFGRLYRIGGDEFCVLIEPDTECDIEQVLADFTAEEAAYNEVPDQPIHLQVACGYAYYKAGQDIDLEQTRERADILMYENKRALKGCEPR
jgi:diguanylate cyclase (GGDEF)-like protein